MKTAAIYTRYSTDNQTENSTAYQIDACEKFCVDKKLKVVGVYSDEVASGTNTNRPEFIRLLEDASIGKFNAIILYDLSRGSRDIIDWFTFRKEMRRLGIEVLSVHDRIGDNLDPSNFLNELLTVGIGQHHVLQSRQKSIEGKLVKAKQGLFMGGTPPLGYDIVNREYIINPIEAEAVEVIFNLYNNGEKIKDICKVLNEQGFKTKLQRPFKITSLYEILRNEKYTGTFVWNKNNNRELHKWVGKANPEDEIIKIKYALPQIIDEQLFEEVQKKITDIKSKTKKSAKTVYPLSGKIYCKDCGAPFHGKTTTSGKGYKTRIYFCSNKPKKLCNSMNLPAEKLEKSIYAAIKDWAQSLDIDGYATQIAKQMQSENNDNTVDRDLDKINRSLENIKSAIRQGIFYEGISEEIALLEKKKSSLEKNLDIHINTFKNLVNLKQLIKESLLESVKKASNATLEKVAQAYTKKITPISRKTALLEMDVVSLQWLPK